MLRIAVLVSGSGTTLANLVDRTGDRRLGARIDRVIGSKHGLGAEGRARQANLSYTVVERRAFDSTRAFSDAVFAHCQDVDLVVCAGWLQLLELPAFWLGRVINIHPALLPAFGGKGMFGRHVHRAVIDHGCKVSGCTVHYVDNTYDTGPIILQRTCHVLDDDTPESLAARVFAQECEALPDAISLIAQGRLKIVGRRVTSGTA
jgi:formyltetrahydrofolate-dependent phosphoribosylglycinamide formyltransferase